MLPLQPTQHGIISAIAATTYIINSLQLYLKFDQYSVNLQSKLLYLDDLS